MTFQTNIASLQAIEIVKSCLLERNYDPKLQPERIIRKSYNRRKENIKKLNTIYSKLGLEPELMMNWDNAQIAARIKEIASTSNRKLSALNQAISGLPI